MIRVAIDLQLEQGSASSDVETDSTLTQQLQFLISLFPA